MISTVKFEPEPPVGATALYCAAASGAVPEYVLEVIFPSEPTPVTNITKSLVTFVPPVNWPP